MPRRKYIYRFFAGSIACFFVWAYSIFPAVAAAAASKVRIPVGTIVVAAFEEEVNPAAVSQGQAVRLSVVNPVVVNGVTVIEAGAPVMGEVSIAQTPGAIGKPAKIGVTLQYVTAVDGTRIPISGQTVVEGENKQTTSLVVTILCCVLGLIMKGGEASIPAGSQVKATTLADAEISTSAEQK